MAKRNGIALAVASLIIYVVGGLFTFGGLAMVAFMRDKDFFALGNGRGIGFLFLCAGLSLSIIGVILMRIFRNR